MIDISEQINAVERTVGRRTMAAGEARTVTITQTYRAALEDVWDACTNAERIPRWFLPITGDLSVGGHYQLEGNAGGTVQTCDAPHGFSATWEIGGDVSWIELRLTALAADRTEFRLEHTAHVDDQRWNEFGPGAVGIGWDMALIGLTLHLASGEAVDPTGAMAWMASPAGHDFITRSGSAWCQAHIAAGDDPDAAQAAAARTLAAYTGTEPDAARS
ncbi:Uncharacterized conserved protein YndB, AHSA1/START domain [Nakamurella panacisegetis]|uniref:Uncharacterized conserved protein YndB, AHSA1/START domain n=1 Tax=Nakamurella panacisegetis TaxID=1090615 RepID=A0A1H0I1G0_9ACTN|nr:SRPBCC family protein [Nakamurella panacisegetis]SDO25292.1 Uncharacterized conserved protein YndB, AHSA1/START domain [Nakamurella panacisegetis]